ncbi:MAG: type III pantothenate kinase [Bacteroidaceae bacterium]
MNLIIDIGNTLAKIAVFDGHILKEVFSSTNQSLDALSEVNAKYSLENGILSSVVTLSDKIKQQLEQLSFEIIYLNENTPIPINNLYQTPESLGNDRLAAVIGANERFPNKDILVIDAGTALTYDFIDARGNYHGGNIAPGMQMRFKSLNMFTNKLPLVKKEGILLDIGTNTDTAIRAGVIKGIEFEIIGYISLLKKNYPELLVFLTGGDEFSFDTNLKSIIFAEKFLVLKGLNRILNYNGRI